MTKALSIYLPTWSSDLLRRRLSAARRELPRAVVLRHTHGGRELVVHCDTAARAAGVAPGMTVSHARSLLSGKGLLIEDDQPDRDTRQLRALAHWAMRFTPMVALDAPDGLMLEMRGCDRLWPGNRAMLMRISRAFEKHGLHVRAALAPSYAAAWALARFAPQPHVIAPPPRLREKVAALPIRALRLDSDIEQSLALLSVQRVQHLLALPRAELADRFGSDLLLALDQLLGQATETFDAISATEPVQVAQLFPSPLMQAEALALAVRDMLQELAHKLEAQQMGLQRMVLHVDRLGAPPLNLTIRISAACCDSRHLWTLMAPKLEKLHMGFGIEELTLHALQLQRLTHHQQSHWQPKPPHQRRQIGQMLDVMAQRMGAQRLLAPAATASHWPETTQQCVSVLTEQRSPQSESEPAQVTTHPRPSLLLSPPRRVDVIALMPEGPPTWIKVDGQGRRIVSCTGPERITEEWWRSSDMQPQSTRGRDYFKVQDEAGQWLWIYRDLGSGNWLLHGHWS